MAAVSFDEWVLALHVLSAFAFVAGLISTSGLVSYSLDKWFGLSGNWALLFAGVALIVTLVMNPEGVAGANYTKVQQYRARRARRASTPVPETTPSS